MCGGLTEEKQADEAVQNICDAMKPLAEQKTGRNFEVFTAKSYKTQLVAGTNYFIKKTFRMADIKCGRSSGVKDADEKIQKICDEVKCQVEEKTNETYEVFKAVQYKSQPVQGVNYAIRVHVGGDSYLLLRVWKKLPCYGGDAVLSSVQ
ncbi:cystatin-B isoform X1 [Oreochromis niloticus]|nr:cystatin-B isoform X1 [Oreochromis niloticus]XP_019212183.1 cystatin-B isoform X1 [Oreochromis niloticus]XP_019218689.1 cystatin-B isoform X1 [Oreochromis niloticus]